MSELDASERRGGGRSGDEVRSPPPPGPVAVLNASAARAELPAPLHAAWLLLLQRYRFDWFCTLTFREQPHPERATKLFRFWVSELNSSLYGRRWMRTPHGGVYWVLAAELQKRGVLHFHALVGDVLNLNMRARRLAWMDRWNELAGFAKVEEIRDDEAVHRYVSKYVTKGGEIDTSSNMASFAQQYLLARSRR